MTRTPGRTDNYLPSAKWRRRDSQYFFQVPAEESATTGADRTGAVRAASRSPVRADRRLSLGPFPFDSFMHKLLVIWSPSKSGAVVVPCNPPEHPNLTLSRRALTVLPTLMSMQN